MTKRKTPSIADTIVQGLEEFADDLEAGLDLGEKYNLHRVAFHLQPTQYDQHLVRQTRQLLQSSQAVFARFLGVSVQTVQAWEQGAKQPSEMARRFLDEIRHEPAYWRKRLRQMLTAKPSTRTAG